VFTHPVEFSLVECRYILAGRLAVGLRGHNPRLVGHHLPRNAAREDVVRSGTEPTGYPHALCGY